METNFQRHMPCKESLEVTQMDCDKYLSLFITFRVGDGDSTTAFIFGKYCQVPLSRPKPQWTMYSWPDMSHWKVVTTNSTSKGIPDVHRLVLTTQSTTVHWVAIIDFISCMPLPGRRNGIARALCSHYSTCTTQQGLMGHHEHCPKRTNWPDKNYIIALWIDWRGRPKYETRSYSINW